MVGGKEGRSGQSVYRAYVRVGLCVCMCVCGCLYIYFLRVSIKDFISMQVIWVQYYARLFACSLFLFVFFSLLLTFLILHLPSLSAAADDAAVCFIV